MTSENYQLREKLDEILKIKCTDLEYSLLIEELRKEHNHHIQIIPDSLVEPCLNSYNCYAFALNVYAHVKYQELYKANKFSARINSGFIHHLINANLLSETEELKTNNLVIYFNLQKAEHAGLVAENGFIHSKWGNFERHQHALWEVRASYGNIVKIFEPIDPDCVMRLFKEYELHCIYI